MPTSQKRKNGKDNTHNVSKVGVYYFIACFGFRKWRLFRLFYSVLKRWFQVLLQVIKEFKNWGSHFQQAMQVVLNYFLDATNISFNVCHISRTQDFLLIIKSMSSFLHVVHFRPLNSSLTFTPFKYMDFW